jgi:hypothetical protein
MSIVTINTDAGFYPREKFGSYAYWIKGGRLFLRGSGIFRDRCKNPQEAELKAIINAVTILLAYDKYDVKFTKLIINRDCIHAKSNENGSDLEKMLASLINKLKRKCKYDGQYPFYEFRHIKAHMHTKTKKNWVNDWCDKQCKLQLKNYVKELKQKKNDKFKNA